MVITNIEKLIGLRFCPKCSLGFRTSDHHRERFNKHLEICDGKFHKKLKRKPSVIFAPQITKNKTLQYVLAHNILQSYKPIKSYITYDFKLIVTLKTNNH
jgi:hypothetical protein